MVITAKKYLTLKYPIEIRVDLIKNQLLHNIKYDIDEH